MKRNILIVVAVIVVIASSITFYKMYKTNKEQAEQIQVLTDQINSMSVEDLVDVVTVTESVSAGTAVDEKKLHTVKWNRASISPNMITDVNIIKDKIWKIDVTANGPVTADMVTKERYGPTDRLQMVIVDGIAPSLQVGDYIDVRMVTPYGINYVVMSKKRVNNIYEAGIELVMSEAELMVYSGLMIDQFMNPGTMVYTSKYLEPTLQRGNYTMYVPPQDILDYMEVNANMLYPYLSSDNVQGLRAYIESTQPWTLYGPSTFQTVTQEIIDKQSKVTASNDAFANAMQSARSEYQSRQNSEATGGGSTSTPDVQASGTGSAQTGIDQAGGGVGADGTYVDSQGVTRDAQGNPIINPSDLGTGVTDVNQGTGVPNKESVDEAIDSALHSMDTGE